MPYIHIAAEPDLDAPRVTEVTVAGWYPQMPPMLVGESVDAYSNRLIGAGPDPGVRPYNHRRRRQCSLGFHDECTDPDGVQCQCPCHVLGAT